MIGHFTTLSKAFMTRTCSIQISKVGASSKLQKPFILSSPRFFSSEITRVGVENPNMSQIVVHNGIVYISGQVDDTGSDVKTQTENVLKKVDSLLEEAGTDKSKLLTANIWLKDIGEDFQNMNSVWSTWLDSDNKPVRATGKVAFTVFHNILRTIFYLLKIIFKNFTITILFLAHYTVEANMASPNLLVEIQVSAVA